MNYYEKTLRFLEYQLHHNGIKETKIFGNPSTTYNLFRFFTYSPPENDTLYLIEYSALPSIRRYMGKCTFLIVCTPGDVIPEYVTRALVVHTDIEYLELYNILYDSTYYHARWIQLLTVDPNITLDDIFAMTENVIHCPVVLMNTSFQVAACTSNAPRSSLFRMMKDREYLDNYYSWSQEFLDMKKRREPYCYKDSYLNCEVACCNIFVFGQYYGRILSVDYADDESSLILQMLQQSATLLEEYFNSRYQDELYQRKNPPFDNCLRQIIDGTIPESFSRIEAYNWHRNDCYRICLFRFNEIYPWPLTSNHVHDTIVHYMGECFVKVDNDYIISLCNITLSGRQTCDVSQELVYFLRENICKVSFSSFFTDICEAKKYIAQCYSLFRIGEKLNPMFYYYRFEDYSLPYMMEKCREDYPTADLVKPQLLMLRDSKPELYETLRQYVLNLLNANQTADTLHIHRTTLKYRLNTIQQLTGLQFENFDTFLHLALSFELLDS